MEIVTLFLLPHRLPKKSKNLELEFFSIKQMIFTVKMFIFLIGSLNFSYISSVGNVSQETLFTAVDTAMPPNKPITLC